MRSRVGEGEAGAAHLARHHHEIPSSRTYERDSANAVYANVGRDRKLEGCASGKPAFVRPPRTGPRKGRRREDITRISLALRQVTPLGRGQNRSHITVNQ